MLPRNVVFAVASLLLACSAALAQTPEIQKQVEKKLDDLRKDQATLEDLLSLALKNNPDIRVADSKLREAEAELYRARMKVVNRIVTLQQELKTLHADVDRAKERYEYILKAAKAGAAPRTTVDQDALLLQKAKTELARAEAEMDLLVGRHTAQAGMLAEWLGKSITSSGGLAGSIRVWDAIGKPGGIEDYGSVPATGDGTLSDKIRKALDTTVQVDFGADYVDARVVLDLLRKYTKGINIQDNFGKYEAKASLKLKEPIPLGAFFQWAEDQFNWRFIIREYGIVAVSDRERPPGGMLLLDFWRKSKVTGAAQ